LCGRVWGDYSEYCMGMYVRQWFIFVAPLLGSGNFRNCLFIIITIIYLLWHLQVVEKWCSTRHAIWCGRENSFPYLIMKSNLLF
jgi:hypothetical protein